MGNEIEHVLDSSAEENHEDVVIPLFAQNMVEIGRIVSRYGTTPPAYGEAPIKFLTSCEDESQGFRAEVYLDINDPYMVLVKRGYPTQRLLLPYYDHVNINYRPDTRTGLRVNKADYPELEEFEKPDVLLPGCLFRDYSDSISFWMPSAMLGPKTLDFLNRITAEALNEFTVLDQNEQVKNPGEIEQS